MEITPTVVPQPSDIIGMSDEVAMFLVAGLSLILLTIILLFLLTVVAYWKIYAKADVAGWKALVPFYNLYILLKIVGRPGWWLLLFIIPVVNIVIAIMVSLDLGKVFGKKTLWSVLLLMIFQPVGIIILGFGNAEYRWLNKSKEVA